MNVIINTLWICTSVAAVIFLHEATHLLVARLISPISITPQSYVPLRIKIDFERNVTTAQIAAVALAPTIFGVALAVFVVFTGVWEALRVRDPYYLHGIMLLTWVLYSIPSPADIRLLSK